MIYSVLIIGLFALSSASYSHEELVNMWTEQKQFADKCMFPVKEFFDIVDAKIDIGNMAGVCVKLVNCEDVELIYGDSTTHV